MKRIATWLGISVLVGHLFHSAAAVFETDNFNSINQPIPDNLATGFSDTRSIASAITSLSDVNVVLNISGNAQAFNGDFYVYVQHDSGFSVLMNRVGRRSDNSFGYSDNGVSVKLDDQAGNGDIHQYRLTLSGNQNTPVDSNFVNPLTGIWAPDGRNVNPSSTLATDPRTALLNSFNGLDANGNWTLFIADLGSGGAGQLDSWGLEFTGVPEPTTYGVIFGLISIAWLLYSRRSRLIPMERNTIN